MKAQKNGINVCFIDVVSHTTCLGLVNDNRLRCSTDVEHTCRPRGRGGGVLGSIFAGYVLLASQGPYPIIVYSVANYRPHLSHFWANV